jgi:hypothetical protein
MQLRIKEAWRSYRNEVIPSDAPNIQHIESRRAFYAGAQALLAILMTMLEPGTEATEADIRKMDEIAAELKRFSNDVREGRA